MNNKNIIIVAIVALSVIVLFILGFFILQTGRSGMDPEKRSNIIKLINRYIDKGEYERALDKIEALLMEEGDNQELLDLQDKVLNAKNEKKDQEDSKNKYERQRIIESMNTMIDKTEEKPTIIKRNIQENSSKQNSTQETDSKEADKKKKLDKLIEEGLDAYNDQNYAIAKDKFSKALDLDNDNAEAHAYLGATIYDENPKNQKNIEEAIKYLKRSQKEDPNLEAGHFKLAQIYSDQGLTDLAVEEYKETLKINPKNYEAYYALGKIYYAKGDFENAKINFYNSVKLKTDFVQGFFYLANSEYKLNMTNESIRDYKKTISLDPNFYMAHANLAKIYKINKDYANAMASFQNTVRLNNKFNYHLDLGDCYRELNQPERAITSYLTSVSLNPQSNEKEKRMVLNAYEWIAYIEMNRARYEESLKYVEKGLQLNLSSSFLYFISGFSKSKIGRISEALNDYLTALDIDPNDIETLINLSSLYNDTQQYDKAISIAQRGLTVNGSRYELYNNIGSSYKAQSNYDQAITAFKQGIEINPGSPVGYFNLGTCYKKTDNSEGAIQSFQKAINLKMDYYDAYFELGESYFTNKQFDEAKSILNILISRKPDYSQRDQVDRMLSVIGK